MQDSKRYVRVTKFPWKVIEKNVVIVNPEENRVLNLTEVGAEIWSYLDGTKTIDEIVENICLKFAVERSRAHKDTTHFLNLLLKEELIQEVR